MTEYDFGRVTVPEPEPVAVEHDRHGKRWIGLAVITLGIVAGCYFGHMHKRVVETYPPDGPSATFGQTTAPEPDRCEVPQCHEYGFLARFVDALDRDAESPVEVRDVLARSYAESRFTPTAVSDTGDYGICQLNAVANPDVDVQRLTTDPEYAAVECLRVYRIVKVRCGDNWQCCYRRGVAGCRRAGK